MKTDFTHLTFFLESAVEMKKSILTHSSTEQSLLLLKCGLKDDSLSQYNHAVDFLTYWTVKHLYAIQKSTIT